MAEFFTNYAQPQQRTSLADMVNAASGIQNFQQAQQLQPLQLQEAQLRLQQAQQMNPLQLQEAQAKLQTAQQGAQKGGIELSQAEQANKERLAMQAFMANPENFQTDGEVDQEKINKAIPGLAPMTGTKYIEDLSKLAKSQTDAASAKNQLTTQERGIFGATFLEKANSKVTDPEEYKKSLDDIAEQYDSKHVKRLAETYKKSIDLIKDPAMLPQIAGKIGLGMMTPTGAQEIAAPKIQVTPSGQTVTTQNMPGQAPTATVGVAQGFQQPQQPQGVQGAQMGAAFDHNAPTPLPHPVRSAGQPYIPNPTEADDTAKGTTYRQGLLGAQSNLVTAKRNNQETLQTVDEIENALGSKATGWTGEVARKFSKFAGTELGQRYIQLSKDIANQQLSAMNDAQLKTDAGKHLAALASGDETYPPSVLRNIVRRNDAQLTGTDMQATAAQNFYRKFGDNNMADFQQNWSKNADSRLFEAASIVNSIQNPAQQKAELDKIMPSDPAQRKIFLEKWRNLKKLTSTGEL